VLVVLDESRGLFEVISSKMSCKTVNLLLDNRNSVPSNYDTFHLHGAELGVPVVISDVRYSEPFGRVRLQNLLD